MSYSILSLRVIFYFSFPLSSWTPLSRGLDEGESERKRERERVSHVTVIKRRREYNPTILDEGERIIPLFLSISFFFFSQFLSFSPLRTTLSLTPHLYHPLLSPHHFSSTLPILSLSLSLILFYLLSLPLYLFSWYTLDPWDNNHYDQVSYVTTVTWFWVKWFGSLRERERERGREFDLEESLSSPLSSNLSLITTNLTTTNIM